LVWLASRRAIGVAATMEAAGLVSMMVVVTTAVLMEWRVSMEIKVKKGKKEEKEKKVKKK